jgi:hypothetical protein
VFLSNRCNFDHPLPQVTHSQSPPAFVAPRHPRLDHLVFYAGLGSNGADMIKTIGQAHPYYFGRADFLSRTAARLLESDSPVWC